MHAKNILYIAAVLLTGALALTGCGTDSSNSSSDNSDVSASASTGHNKVDTTFAQEMIPHHGQAIDMARMAKTRASSGEVKELASNIEAAQGPEIAKMTGWLNAWGESVPSTDMEGMSGMDHGGDESMPGMMSNDDMHRLEKAHGAAFDRMFLQMMIEHHQGALEMAETEKAQGKNPHAVELAESIETTQTAEIAKMRRILDA